MIINHELQTTQKKYMRSELPLAVATNVMPCSLVDHYQCFWTNLLHPSSRYMEGGGSFETLVIIHHTTQCDIFEIITIHHDGHIQRVWFITAWTAWKILFNFSAFTVKLVCGSVVGWGTMLQAER
jgi:hypothetical protein